MTNDSKKVNQVWPVTTKKKPDSVSDSSKFATRHKDGTGKQKYTAGTTAETDKFKEPSQCQPKAQSIELVKQPKAQAKHVESGKQISQSESVCEQDNADLQATTMNNVKKLKV